MGGDCITSLTSVASMGGITGGGGDCITSLTSVASMGGITGGGGLYYQFD